MVELYARGLATIAAVEVGHGSEGAEEVVAELWAHVAAVRARTLH